LDIRKLITIRYLIMARRPAVMSAHLLLLEAVENMRELALQSELLKRERQAERVERAASTKKGGGKLQEASLIKKGS
jgi:hypothetical protein